MRTILILFLFVVSIPLFYFMNNLDNYGHSGVETIMINQSIISKLHPQKNLFNNYLKFYKNKDFTPKQFMGLKNITHEDKIWVAIRLIPKDQLRYVAADLAELVLPIWEEVYPKDDRPRKAVEAARSNVNVALAEKAINAAYNTDYDDHIPAYVDAAGAAFTIYLIVAVIRANGVDYVAVDDIVNMIANDANTNPTVLKKIRTICLRYLQ